MPFDLGVDRLPFAVLPAGGLFAHSDKAGDVIRPGCFAGMRGFLVITLGPLEYIDVSHAVGLLRAGGERPRRNCAAEKRDEIPPLHCLPLRLRTAHGVLPVAAASC